MRAATYTDILVVGGGPAGTALAAACAHEGLSVRVVAPHPPTPYPATYGAWLTDLPAWAHACAAQVWTDVRVYTGPDATPLQRPYALLDNAALLRALLARGGAGLTWTQGRVVRHAAGPDGHVVEGRGGERWTAALVVDASGHGGTLAPTAYPDGPAYQTAWGLTATFARPPIPPGAMVWMDWRPVHAGGPTPTFLYAMHLGADRYFVQETTLVARPATARPALEARLHARLHAAGTPPGDVHATEWVAFPMNGATPDPGPVLRFGAAAGLVHPISGFQVAAALHASGRVAAAVAGALRGGTDAAAAGWAAVWPDGQRAARDVHLLGVRALLGLPPHALPPFFTAFFDLPPERWHAFLDPATPAGTLARIMLRLFADAPPHVRGPLARAALTRPASSARALAAAWRAPDPARP